MTFDEWWAQHDPNDVLMASDRTHAEMVWAAAQESLGKVAEKSISDAVANERERCAKIAEGYVDNNIDNQDALAILYWIRKPGEEQQ